MFEVLSGCNVIGHGIFGSMASNYEPPQPPNYDNIEMEGMGTLTLPNSLKAPIDRLQLLGNSTQGCTIKVLSTELEHGTINAGNGENFPSNYRVRTKGFSDIQKGKYKVTCEGAKQANIIFYSTDGIYKNTLFKAHTVFPFYFTANEACKIRVAVSNGTEEEAIAIKPENVKSITVATEATPEYPQEIKSVGRKSRNLFDISKLKSGMIPPENINIEESTITLPTGGVMYFNKLKDVCTDLKVGDEVYLFAKSIGTKAFAGFYHETASTPLWNFNTKRTVTEEMLNSTLLLYSDFDKSVVLSGIMITKVNDKIYEPYTGGKPSQSVEYPQEIVSAGKWDEVSGKYAIDVSVTGKNLFDISQYDKYDDTWTNTTYTTKKLKLKPNTTYTMSCKRLVDKPKQYVIFNIVSGIKTGKAISVQINPSLQLNYFFGKGTFTTGETGEIVLSYYVDCPKEKYWFTEVIGDIQIELGSIQTAYVAYKEPQTTQITLDEPLRGIGEYKDVITKDGIKRKIKEIVLDENTGFETYWATLNKTFAFISPTIKDATVINGTPNRLLCNYSKALPDGFDRTDEEVCVLFNRRFHIRFLKERNIDTVEKLKEWLKQNPIKVQYLLQEPVLEMIENSLENLHANDGTTIITVDSGEVETGIKLTYRKEK